ncbi:hypothetical protein SAMN04487767_1465 [Bacillus wiedmannii]|uniref:Uncharacterized protein n=1 Tax=Bacillus wiedmannii TaxID=1890302 RepID=A0A1G7G3I0_9BACI|nr:hypothetical protein [Bacillus wiedmannii]SDE82645.1 hypothetical protein SAMN04487767_1465 [Bacillus wiedmannii]
MEKWISRGSKVSWGIYILLAAIGIGYMFWEINAYNHEWTKNSTVTAITVFCTFYVIMLAVEIGFMNRKLTKKTLLLEIPFLIVISIGLLVVIVFLEVHPISGLTSVVALLMSTPFVFIFLRMGYKQWKFYNELVVLLEKGE